MKKPLPSQTSDHHQRDQADADAGALHVGLERRPAAAVGLGAALAALAAEQAAELAVEVAPQLVEVGRAVVAAGHRHVRSSGVPRHQAQRRPARPGARRSRRRGRLVVGGRCRARAHAVWMVWADGSDCPAIAGCDRCAVRWWRCRWTQALAGRHAGDQLAQAIEPGARGGADEHARHQRAVAARRSSRAALAACGSSASSLL